MLQGPKDMKKWPDDWKSEVFKKSRWSGATCKCLLKGERWDCLLFFDLFMVFNKELHTANMQAEYSHPEYNAQECNKNNNRMLVTPVTNPR